MLVKSAQHHSTAVSKHPEKQHFYYCRHCKCYTDKFWPSQLKRGSRICNLCLREQQHRTQSKASVKALLRRKLLDNLNHRGIKCPAKTITPKVFDKILEEHNIEECNIDNIQRFSAVLLEGNVIQIIPKRRRVK